MDQASDEPVIPDRNELPGYLAGVLPPDLVESATYLQQAIDIRLENDVVRCMRAAGFVYQPLDIAHVPTRDNPVLDALDALDPDAPAPFVDPNAEYLASLSPAEERAWQAAVIPCAVDSPYNIDNPLGTGPGWGEAMDAANERVQADPRFIEAMVTEEACKADAGFDDDVPREISRIDQEAFELGTAGERTAEVVNQLYELLDRRALLVDAQSLCSLPRLDLTRQLYNQFAVEELQNNPQLELSLNELRRTVEAYGPEIASILEG